MASVNKVHLLGRLTREPESRSFANGGKVTKFAIAVDGSRKKNPSTGQWESEPCFLDCEAFNRGEHGRLADTIAQYGRKGSQVYVEGHLVMQQWTTQDGQKRSAIRVAVDVFQFVESRGGGQRQEREPAREERQEEPAANLGFSGGEDIPF